MRIDLARERGRVVAGQESVQGQLRVLGIGHVAGRDGETAAHALDQQVVAGRVRVRARGNGQLESAEDLQGDQNCQALAVGRALPDPPAAVVDGQRLHPLAAVRGEVFRRQHAARLAHGGHHPLGDRSAVERLRALAAQARSEAGKRGNAHHLAGMRRAALREQFGAVARRAELAGGGLPQARTDGRHRVPGAGQLGGRLHHLRTRQDTETGVQVSPGGRSAGHGHVVGVASGQDGRQPLAPQQLQAQSAGAAPGAVEGVHGAARRLVVEHEAVAAEPGLAGHGDLHAGRRRQRRVGRAAPGGEHAQAEQRRLR